MKLRFEGGAAPTLYSPYAPWARKRLSIADCDSWFGLKYTEARKSRTKSRTHKKLGYCGMAKTPRVKKATSSGAFRNRTLSCIGGRRARGDPVPVA